jgi:hypothetical protein
VLPGNFEVSVRLHEECMRTWESTHASECYVVVWTHFERTLLLSQRINTKL